MKKLLILNCYNVILNKIRNGFFITITIFILIFFLFHPHIYCYEETIQSLKGIKSKQKTILVTSSTPNIRQTGLRIYKPEKCYNGYTLFASPSLKSMEEMVIHCKHSTALWSHVYLIDMKGKVVYQWEVEPEALHAQLKPNGNLLYNVFMSPAGLLPGIREVDPHGNILRICPGNIVHDFHFLKGGNVLIEENTYACGSSESVLSDRPQIKKITPRGKILWSWSAIEHLNELEKLTGIQVQTIGYWAIINTCEILKSSPLAKIDTRFRKGNIIFSSYILSVVGIIDYLTGEIVWAWGPGEIEGQHTPTMLDNGNLLIFDNGIRRGWSRVIELNPLTKEIIWEYHAEPKGEFFTPIGGGAIPLPNGNILIYEGIKNRIFEITHEGEIVWDFISTFNQTTVGDPAIFRAYRYSPEYIRPLLKLINKQ